MRKNKSYLFGMLAAVLALSATLGACGGKGGSGGAGKAAGAVKKAKASPASDFIYDLNEAGDGIFIYWYTGKGGAVVIPAEIDGFPVVAIAVVAFSGNNKYNKDYFNNCNAVTSVVIADSVTTIGSGAFEKMKSLTSLTLPKGLAAIPFQMCAGSANLSELKNIPATVEFVDTIASNRAFVGCGKLPLPVRKQLQDLGYKDGFLSEG